jgi:protein-S-isoprenylcysteine O-methyltransferase Ste14
MRLIQGLKDIPVFSPSKWPHREGLSRCVALLIITCFFVIKLVKFDQFPQTWSAAALFYGTFKTAAVPIFSHSAIATIWGCKLTVWIIETGILAGYMAAYFSRAKALSIANGFMETAFPIIVAGIPVLISLSPYTLPQWAPFNSPNHVYVYLAVMGLLITGGLINLIGLLTMRRAFTIMTEARVLVTNGIFSSIRHPLYSGHFIMFLGSLLLRLNFYTIAMYFLFVVGQVIRARMEERKLMQAFPDFTIYKKQTGMFWPKL